MSPSFTLFSLRPTADNSYNFKTTGINIRGTNHLYVIIALEALKAFKWISKNKMENFILLKLTFFEEDLYQPFYG